MSNITILFLVLLIIHIFGTLIWCEYVVSEYSLSKVQGNKFKFIVIEFLLGILFSWLRIILETLYSRDR